MTVQPATAVVAAPALAGAAIETRGGWTWSFPCDLATPAGWVALDGGVTLTAALSTAYGQRTPGLGAPGVGSPRLNQGVLAGATSRFLSGATYVNPATAAVHVRLIFRDPRTTVSGSTYFELSDGSAQNIVIRRSGTTLRLEAELGVYAETADFSGFAGNFILLDIILDPVREMFVAWLNGIDLTPSFESFGDPLTAFAGVCTLALLNNIAGTEPAIATVLVFAGVTTTPELTLAQHRADARLLDVLADDFSGDGLGDYTWAWSPNRVVEAAYEGAAVTLPGEPDFGEDAAVLTIEGEVVFDQSTGSVRGEGLGRARLDHAFGPTEVEDSIASASSFEAVTGALHLRLVFYIESDLDETQTLFVLTDDTHAFGVAVASDGDLTLTGPSGYSVTLPSAIVFDSWHLLDLSLDRDISGGNAGFVALLDGADLDPAAAVGAVADIADGATAYLCKAAADDTAATKTLVAFAALTQDRILGLARHVADACALEVMT